MCFSCAGLLDCDSRTRLSTSSHAARSPAQASPHRGQDCAYCLVADVIQPIFTAATRHPSQRPLLARCARVFDELGFEWLADAWASRCAEVGILTPRLRGMSNLPAARAHALNLGNLIKKGEFEPPRMGRTSAGSFRDARLRSAALALSLDTYLADYHVRTATCKRCWSQTPLVL